MDKNTRLKYCSYIGLEWQELDCWQLVTKVLNEQFSILLPDLNVGAKLDIDTKEIQYENERKDWRLEWKQVEEPQEGDLVLFAQSGVTFHIGLVIDSNSFLHSTEATGCVVEKLSDSFWKSRLDSFYRYKE